MRAVVLSVITIALSSGLIAQTPQVTARRPDINIPNPPILLRPIFQPIVRDAGKIFSGTVLEVEHQNSGSSSALATTNIRFRVDEAIRGVRKSEIVEVKEWAGLWESGERYHPGERVLLFLYPPSKLGLTSPVGHRAGRFPVNSTGGVLLPTNPGAKPKPIEIHKVVAAIREAEQE